MTTNMKWVFKKCKCVTLDSPTYCLLSLEIQSRVATLKSFCLFNQILFYSSKGFMLLKKKNLPAAAALQPYSQNRSTSSRQISNTEKQANKKPLRDLLNVSLYGFFTPSFWSCCDPPLSHDSQLLARRTETSGRAHWEPGVYIGAEQPGEHSSCGDDTVCAREVRYK